VKSVRDNPAEVALSFFPGAQVLHELFRRSQSRRSQVDGGSGKEKATGDGGVLKGVLGGGEGPQVWLKAAIPDQ
jgi:hypothetical protein